LFEFSFPFEFTFSFIVIKLLHFLVHVKPTTCRSTIGNATVPSPKMSCPPLPRSLLTFLLLLFFSEALVSCDTHMCRRFSRTARTTAAPRRKTSCVRAHVAKGRLYNSITIYVEIDRKSPDCSIPQNPFVLSLQVVNPFGYPVGDPVKGFQPSNIPETSCDPPPPGITSHYAQDAALQLIPCFYFKDGDYTQIVNFQFINYKLKAWMNQLLINSTSILLTR